MFKAFTLTICLLLLSLLTTFELQARDVTCRSYSSDELVESLGLGQTIDLISLKTVQVACIEDYTGDYDTRYVKGFTQADFSTKTIRVFMASQLSGVIFRLTLVHEMTHVQQYFSWMKNKQQANEMVQKLNTIHKLVNPQRLNASFQTLAKMKRYPAFKTATKSWYKAYVNMQFCMEFQAYSNELHYANRNGITAGYLPVYLKAMQKNNLQPLLDLLNETLVKRLFDSLYTNRELRQVYSVCQQGNTPLEWFSASAEAL